VGYAGPVRPANWLSSIELGLSHPPNFIIHTFSVCGLPRAALRTRRGLEHGRVHAAVREQPPEEKPDRRVLRLAGYVCA
jgi:hypothetical protein